MSRGLGTSTVQTVGRLLTASAGAISPKAGGVTIDWANANIVAVSGADLTLTDGRIVPIGAKFIRYGTVLCKITASGKFAPYTAGKTDGTQLLALGDTFILDSTVLESDERSEFPSGVFDDGLVFKSRITNNAADLTTNPTPALAAAAMPNIRFVTD